MLVGMVLLLPLLRTHAPGRCAHSIMLVQPSLLYSLFTRRPPGLSQGEPPLVAHRGVSRLALDLYDQLVPYLDSPLSNANTSSGRAVSGAPPQGPVPICFAGHSLGGALCLLLTALYQAQHRAGTAAELGVFTGKFAGRLA